jgi:hypothetical protein
MNLTTCNLIHCSCLRYFLAGFSIDAEATLDFVLQRNDINVRRVFVHGSSLGGAVATYVASLPYYADRIAGLLLENTFTCIPDMGRSLFAVNLLKYLPQWVFSEQVGNTS